MNKKKMKLAFIGGGINSAVGNTHKIASQMDGRFELTAGCFSRNEETNMKTADAWGVDPARAYKHWPEMLAEEKNRVDAVVILTPTDNHTDIVIKCIESGYPVICEKALTTSSSAAVSIQEAVKKDKGFLVVTYNYTGYPMLRELKLIVSSGRLGKINQVHVEMPQEGFLKLDKNGNPPKPQNWRLHDGDLPTISLDLGVHLHNIIEFLTGEKPVEAFAVSNSFGLFHQVIDNVIGVVNYSNNVVCNYWYSKSALGHRNGLRVRIYGENGSAEWYQMEPEIILLNDNIGNKSSIDRTSSEIQLATEPRYNRFKAGHPAGFIEAFANYYYDIADSLENYLSGNEWKSDYVFTVNSALNGLRLFEALAESSKMKHLVKMDGI